MNFTRQEGAPVPDAAALAALVGKRILVGITYLRSDETVESQVQIFGIVSAASEQGIDIALEGKRQGETFTLPPDLRAIQPAKPGVYNLRSTQETVIDPDYLAVWTVQKPETEQ